VLDTQGAELLVLKGCEENLQTFQYICVEAADFDVYQGAPTAQEISLYLSRFGFDPTDRERFGEKFGVGSCFNILFKKKLSRKS